jgi:hypothetical protein
LRVLVLTTLEVRIMVVPITKSRAAAADITIRRE